MTAASGGEVLDVEATLVGDPIARVPKPAPGYPALALGIPAQWLVAGAWGLVAGLAWVGRRLLVRAIGAAGTIAAAVVVGLCLLEAFVAVGHALPGLT
ncbi:MAG: hypothetical protein U0P45_13805 [Acidimicrobiales bacterium]